MVFSMTKGGLLVLTFIDDVPRYIFYVMWGDRTLFGACHDVARTTRFSVLLPLLRPPHTTS